MKMMFANGPRAGWLAEVERDRTRIELPVIDKDSYTMRTETYLVHRVRRPRYDALVVEEWFVLVHGGSYGTEAFWADTVLALLDALKIQPHGRRDMPRWEQIP